MKSFSLIALLSVGMATAFMPNQASLRSVTKVHLNDPEMLHHIIENWNDATRVVMNECSSAECQQVEAVNEYGHWNFIEGPAGQTKAQILMVEHDDCE